MLTLNDCIAFSDLLPEEIEEISRHERLGFVVALAKGHSLLDRPWGAPAIRQMMRDNLVRAMRRGDAARCAPTMEVYHRFQVRHPGGIDRRRTA
ncbi:hypothetical protein JL101_022245 [Skermanella rosea]|uniref:hypothetical protein n=1 Tax=Skermanella rosea TaxID=1817965 RepID=UPI00193348C0|nr:hypothetical protein [Skermanella rosea]UEM02673.1 hypothetical protein JL101_022245 [Skermanella rosea]